MTLQPGKQTTAIHILHKISRIKGNQELKFGRNLVKFDRKYHEKHFFSKTKQNVVEKLPFLTLF